MKKMKKLKRKLVNYGTAIFAGVLVFCFVFGISWITTCGVIKLITMCFGWTFKWSIATGIWLIMFLAGTVFKTTVKK